MATIIEEREPTAKRILKKVTPYSVGANSFDQGDACFSITAFDDYVYFSLTEERGGEEVALDLTGYGGIYLRFKNEDIDIAIKAVEELDSIDPSRGEVVFKVNRENSLNVIASSLNTFAIVSRLEVGSDKSFENIIFQGKFLKPEENTDSISRFDRLYNEESDLKIQEIESNILVLRQRKKDLEAQGTVIQDNINSLSIQFDELDKKYQKTLKRLQVSESVDTITQNPIQSVSQQEIDAVRSKIESLRRPLPTPTPPSNEDDSNPKPTAISVAGRAPKANAGGGVGFNQGEQGSAGMELIAPK